MNINKLISQHLPIRLLPNESKIPWNDADFSQRMLENHLSQEHDWASRKLAVIERQVDWLCSQLGPGAQVLIWAVAPAFTLNCWQNAVFAAPASTSHQPL